MSEPLPSAGTSWLVHTDDGQALYLPPTLSSLSTFVMLEQGQWFEPEVSLLPHLLVHGSHALDIGANHGIYTLAMARLAPGGRVHAFEPTASPRRRLQASVAAAGLAGRVSVVPAGLAESSHTAEFCVQDNSELNSRSGRGALREAVQLLALDAYLAQAAPGVRIDLVKLDAEGDELRVLQGAQQFFAAQSPAVIFELKHGATVNHALLRAWASLGYELFRWSAPLGLLLPFEPEGGELAFALNLVAVRPEQRDALSARGLLVTAAALDAGPAAPTPEQATAAWHAWCSQPAQQARPGEAEPTMPGCGPAYDLAVRQVALAHADAAVGLSAAQRAAAMCRARDGLRAALDAGQGSQPEAWTLLVHALNALGERHAAVRLGSALLARWPVGAGCVDSAMVPPLAEDLQRQRTTPRESWLRHMLAEFVALQSQYSSYFQPSRPALWAGLLEHPDHGVQVERRCLLDHVRSNVPAPDAALSRLSHLGQPADTLPNGHLWHGLIDAMRVQP